jgi:hypothetical protein
MAMRLTNENRETVEKEKKQRDPFSVTEPKEEKKKK